jgi:hypothetical protein
VDNKKTKVVEKKVEMEKTKTNVSMKDETDKNKSNITKKDEADKNKSEITKKVEMENVTMKDEEAKPSRKESEKIEAKKDQKQESEEIKKNESVTDLNTLPPDETNLTAFQLLERRKRTCFVGNLALETTAKQIKSTFIKEGCTV